MVLLAIFFVKKTKHMNASVPSQMGSNTAAGGDATGGDATWNTGATLTTGTFVQVNKHSE